MEISGHCVICGIRVQGKNDFCQQCSDPQSNRIYCARCKRLREITNEDIEELRPHLPLEFPQGPGLVLRLSCCPLCIKPDEEIITEIFRIKATI